MLVYLVFQVNFLVYFSHSYAICCCTSICIMHIIIYLTLFSNFCMLGAQQIITTLKIFKN